MAANSDTSDGSFNLLDALLAAINDGRVDRSAIPNIIAPAGVDPTTGVQSKDVTIPLETAESLIRNLPRPDTLGEKKQLLGTTGVQIQSTAIIPVSAVNARLYMPGNVTPGKKLPLVVYYHGGAFAFNSTTNPTYHKHLNTLVAEAKVVVVSVDYRLAPEIPLPAAYHDSWVAFKWATCRPNQDEWIKNYADLDRVFLGGDSAGGNIAHQMAIWVGLTKRDGINLIGVFLNSPYFFFNEKKNPTDPRLNDFGQKSWRLVCPGTVGHREDPRFNPGMDPLLYILGCTRIRIYTGEYDFVREGCFSYKDEVPKSGWRGRIEILDFKGEDHVFSVTSPDSKNGLAMIKNVASFINNYTPLSSSL